MFNIITSCVCSVPLLGPAIFAELYQGRIHCRQRAPVGNALSSSGTSQLGMFDIQATTKSKYYDQYSIIIS